MQLIVLVVDDHADSVLLFVEELRAAGYDAMGTTSPNEAMNLALEAKPHVIVMDIAMPELDGYELARLVRSYTPTRDTRLIAVSAHAFDVGPEKLPPGGWDGSLKKPVEPGTLTSMVAAVLGAPRVNPTSGTPQAR